MAGGFDGLKDFVQSEGRVRCVEVGPVLLRGVLDQLVVHDVPPVVDRQHLRDVVPVAQKGPRLTDGRFPSTGEPVDVTHLHGLLSSGTAAADLGARLSRVELGLTSEMASHLDDTLRRTEMLVVVGYSGLDYFDVDPYWRDAAARGLMRHLTVVWVNHVQTRDVGWGLSAGDACGRKLLRLAWEGGAQVFEIDAPTRDVLGLVAQSLDMGPLPAPPPWEDRPAVSLTLSDSERERASTRFLNAAGLRRAVAARLRLVGAPDPEQLCWAAESAWARGRYREASRLWGLALPREDNRFARGERQAACLWLRGQLVAARRELVRLSAEAEATGADPTQRLVIAETLARVLVHMRRLPDTRLLVTRRQVAAALETFDRAQSDLGPRLPVHLRARTESVRAAMGAIWDEAASPDVQPSRERDFDEYEALSAMVNYEHSRLRERATDPNEALGRPAPWEYWRLQARHQLLGATADAARVPLLPGASRAFSVWHVARGLVACDFTIWHTMRLR